MNNLGNCLIAIGLYLLLYPFILCVLRFYLNVWEWGIQVFEIIPQWFNS